MSALEQRGNMYAPLKLKGSPEYAEWIDVDDIVAEREMGGTLITITAERGGYSIYRTFQLGGTVAVSVDANATDVENVFNYLLRR